MKKVILGLLSWLLVVSVAVPIALTTSMGVVDAALYKPNEYMAELQLPEESSFNEKDWKQVTIDFLTYMLDESNVYESSTSGTHNIARYTSSSNAKAYFESIGMPDAAPEEIWSIPSYIGRGGDTTMGEGITVIAAVMSGALVGMDLTAYECSDGVTRNFVKSAVEYYQTNGEHVVLNGGSGGRTGSTWWYELLPGVLFTVLGTAYESEAYYMYDIITESARQWRSAVVGLGGASADFWHTSYSIERGEPFDGNWYEPDAAAGMAYILYSAYSLNKNLKDAGEETYATDEEIEQFREAAIWSMNYLDGLNISPFYEVLTFLAPYLAARMNAEQGTNYDVAKMIGWTLDGSSAVRGGWGMITENWGDKYTNGLMGSLTDGNGYAFAMNTFDAMLGFAPMVKYDTRFARDISRWVLAVSQSAQNYYPENYSTEGQMADYYGNSVYHGKYQSGNVYAQDDPEASFIAYEGLRRYRRYVTYDENGNRGTAWDNSVSPYASGDAFTFDWGGETDYGLYGSSHVGLFGSTIEYTDVPMIIRTDLNKLDVYHSGNIPFWMYYNPYDTAKTVTVTLQTEGNRLYDTVEKTYVETSGNGTNVTISIPADTTMVLAEIPAGENVVKNGSTYTCNGEFIAQDRGSVDLALFTDSAGTLPISSGSNVEGTIYASLTAVAPDGATVESITLTYGGTTLYSGTAAPDGMLEIDTAQLRNGSGTMTATLTLSGGSIERSSINLQVLNVDRTSAIEYESAQEMADVWNAATQQWQAEYPNSDHTSSIAAGSDGTMTVTVESPMGYGFVTSELFNLDFSRGPMLEINVTNVSSSYAIKVYIEGMENSTGEYVLRDTNQTGLQTINIISAIQQEDYTFDPEGVHRASIKIIPTGNVGDTVSFSFADFTVYHMYSTPVLDEPDSYDWGTDFTTVWMSLWSGMETDGGVGNALMQYTEEGLIRVTASDETAEYSGIASPLINVDLGQNPVLDISLEQLTGSYFIGVKFGGSDQLYIVADNQTETDLFVEVVRSLRANYPDMSFSGTATMRIIVGVKGSGVAEFAGVNTYYQLTGWGAEIEDEMWADWERASGLTANASFALDSSNRMVITNQASSSNNTATAGISGRFTLNFDYNPELTVRVRAATGSWRLTMTLFENNQKYVLNNWTSGTGTFTLNIQDAVNASGRQNVYLSVEVLGGGSSVTLQYINTFYTIIEPEFVGDTYYAEIATWNKDETNSSNISVNGNNVTVSESARNSKGLFTPAVSALSSSNPYIVVNVAELKEGSSWYLNATVNGITYRIGEGSSTGSFSVDVVRVLAAAGCTVGDTFSAVYELGAEGDAFSVTFSGVRFAYRLNAPAGITHDEESNVLSWQAVSGATGYMVRIEDAEGEEMWSGDVSGTSLSLGEFALKTGVYRAYILAVGTNVISSEESNLPFKQGDIESVDLAAPSNLTVEGTRIVWDAVPNAAGYLYVLTDVDTNETLATDTITDTYVDLAALGMPGFNNRITVQAKGDGVVYLDSETVSYDFYSNVIENYNPSKFGAMASNDNQASATFDETSDIATLTVPYTNWGSIIALETQLNFDNSPVLLLRFAAGCQGGYFMQIMIDGVEYYLADNTFDIHGNTEEVRVYIDINATLNSRQDGPANPFTGVHTVRVIFGATADGFSGANTPVIRFAGAQLIEMTQGRGVERLGTLATPEVSYTNGIASWTAVEHAESYALVVSNELGVLISTTLTENSYDLSILKAAGEYTVQVTAMAEQYFTSDTGSTTFTLTAQQPGTTDDQETGCGSSLVGMASMAVVMGLFAVVAVCIVRKRIY